MSDLKAVFGKKKKKKKKALIFILGYGYSRVRIFFQLTCLIDLFFYYLEFQNQ